MSSPADTLAPEPIDLAYEADLLGNIQQALAGLQGFDVMAFELIQNADDAGARTIVFDVADDGLVVRNDARFSTCGLQDRRCPWEKDGGPDRLKRPCNFHAISKVGSRNKVFASGQIGRFGIGFVSVYQVTDAPAIRSAGIEMQLEPLRGAAPTRPVADLGGTEFELPFASMPSPARAALNASPVPRNVSQLLCDAICHAMEHGLFFLKHLRKVELRRNGVLGRSAAIHRKDGVFALKIEPDDRVYQWKVLTGDGADLAAERDIFTRYPTLKHLNRSPIVEVAIPLSAEPIEGLIYAYLPTEQPSRMPLHINGDFFPHPNRRSIVLTGEQHDRYWNELLLDAAARAVGKSFTELRDALGAVRLWELGNEAFELRNTRGFSNFWAAFSEAAKATPSVITVGKEWRRPSDCRLPPEQLTAAEQMALANIAISLQDPGLRPLSTVLSAVGVTQLRLGAVVDALRSHGEHPKLSVADSNLRALWSAVNRMIEADRARAGFEGELLQLKDTPFLLDSDGDVASIDQLWRPPIGVGIEDIRKYVAGCLLAHTEVANHPAIWATIDVYGFDNLARDLADLVRDEDAAKTIIGEDSENARHFYDFLVDFQVPEKSNAQRILADVPLLRTHRGFVSPSRGQLPGGFIDPIGHFELVDAEPLSDRAQQLVKNILGVRVLTFKTYIEDHLEDILAGEPTRDQYAALLREIVEHQVELGADGGLQPLAEKEFVRTRAGGYVRPGDCYRWSAILESLLGSDSDHWVDEDWMPAGRARSRCLDLLGRLGMRETPLTQHLVARIAKIAEHYPIDEIAKQTTPIIRHIVDRYARFDSEEIEHLEGLRTLAFLPGAMNGERDQGRRYPPALVYRAFRAPGFSSQVVIVDLPPLRGGGGASLTEFLDLLKMPAEPPTEKVVAHLEHCMATKSPASDLTYAILNERLSAPDSNAIDRLNGHECIYDSALKRYLSPEKVFWDPPPFGGHWHAANARMRQHEPLFRRLGVDDSPGAPNYASLMREIASAERPPEEDRQVHARCLDWLANALDQGRPDAEEAISTFEDEYVLLNRVGTPVRTPEAAWVDSPSLAAAFGDSQDDRLIAPPSIHRGAAARLFKQIGVRPLSEIARFCLAVAPLERAASDATMRLRERSGLLLWLAPTPVFRDVLGKVLAQIQVCRTDHLQVRAEIFEFDPPVQSPSSSAAAFYDPETATLHLRASDGEQVDWPAAFRAVFAQLERHSYGVDMRPVEGTAALIMLLPSLNDAEQALRKLDYTPPVVADELPVGRPLADAPEGGTQKVADLGEADDEGEGLKSARESGLGDQVADDEILGQSETNGAGTTYPNPNPFNSKTDKREFGTNAKQPATVGAVPPRKDDLGVGQPTRTVHDGEKGSGGKPRQADTLAERRTRRSRMLTYVVASDNGSQGTDRAGNDSDISELIDEAAIAAALKYEKSRGRVPEEQPHTNPGYDIISRSADGASRRLIEVKGLEGEWTERGIKLSHVQYGMAESYPEEFWIYVVEHARDLQRQRVSAIGNPFSKVDEYWFDDGWRQVAEENASAEDINVTIGARVRHDVWGEGKITAVERRGIATFVTIDFGPIQGKRYIPYGTNLKFLG